MGISLDTGVSIFTVFLQGLLSFFSPCVLPLLPLYISYFSGGASKVDENGNIIYPKTKIFLNTIFFVLGISLTFFILGFSFTAFGRFLNSKQVIFSRLSGIIMILFGIYQFGIFGKSKKLETERRINIDFSKFSNSFLSAFILGFTFSFSWTPCIGPIMSGVLLMASSSATVSKSILLIFVYVLGFTIPFLISGLFTASLLSFFRKHQNIVKYTVKAGAILLILMGIMTFTGFINGINSYLAKFTNNSGSPTQVVESTAKSEDESIASNKESTKANEESGKASEETTASKKELPDAFDFTLVDQNGITHKLSDYKGKTVFLNFWATWCPPCRAEMPDIQKMYEDYGNNSGDLIVLGIASPNIGNESDADGIANFLKQNSYTYPVVMDEGASIATKYGIRAYPTTFMINTEGKVFGYVTGALDARALENIVKQTMDSTK